MIKNNDCTVLVISCDEYQDMIPPFSALWRKNWPDCPFEVVMVTENEAGSPACGVFDKVIYTHKTVSWSERVATALRQIDTPFVLLFLNDYFVSGKVPTSKVLIRLEQAIRFNALNLRLIPMPRAQLAFDSGDEELPLREYIKNTAYCIATQLGFWDKKFLLRMVERTNSAWEFERKGSLMVGDEKYPILSVVQKEFPFLDAVHKGFWEKETEKLLAANAVKVDFSRRGFVPASVKVKEYLRAKVVRMLPRAFLLRLRLKIKGA
ncbi:MAG: hypothetical protein IJ173_03190 [Kiritimatiellae bacterium]|nr:hypothetical protein [Kiritimatiellia bacterium]